MKAIESSASGLEDWPMPPVLDLGRQLERMLKSRVFAARPRSAEMLRFFVDESLRNGGGPISQDVIARQALGFGASFSPNRSADVRVKVARLRAALDRYYRGPGRGDPVVFAVSAGPYRLLATRNGARHQDHSTTDPRAVRRSRPTLAVVELGVSGQPVPDGVSRRVSLRLVSRLAENTLVTGSGPLSRDRIAATADSAASLADHLGYDYVVEPALCIDGALWRVRVTITRAHDGTTAADAKRIFDPQAHESIVDDIASWIHDHIGATCATASFAS